MHKFFDLLASEVYLNYFLAISSDTMVEAVDKTAKDKTIYYSKDLDLSIISIEKDGKFYYNTDFVIQITNKISEYLERDVALFKSDVEIQTHFYFLCLFTICQIKDATYLETFFAKYPPNYYE